MPMAKKKKRKWLWHIPYGRWIHTRSITYTQNTKKDRIYIRINK